MELGIVTEEQREKASAYIKEAVKATIRQREEGEHIKDILNTLKNDFDIVPKISRKVIEAHIKGNFAEVVAENTAYEDLSEITGVNK
tara:strand:- start:5952 stop:6212 length:261 start_codon:yes stop_codon:yes gene_type:complete